MKSKQLELTAASVRMPELSQRLVGYNRSRPTITAITEGVKKALGKREQKERKLQKAVSEFLSVSLPSGAWFTSIPGGNRGVTVCPGYQAGVPDMLVVARGRPIFIELKAPKKNPTAEQLSVHEQITLSGGLVLVARSVDDVQNFLIQIIPLKARVS